MERVKRCLARLYVADMLPADVLTGLKVDPKTLAVVPFLKHLGSRDRRAADFAYLNQILQMPDSRDLGALSFRDVLFPTDLEPEYRV